MKPVLTAVVIACFSLHTAAPSWARKWTDASGKFSIEAELVEVKADKAVLRKSGGAEISVPLLRLSQADRQYLQSLGHRLSSQAGPPADRRINALLERVRKQSDVPALAGAIVTSDGLAAFGATGVRKRGTNPRVTANDLWHLGSNTKAITATLVAKLVEQDQLSWDTTLAEVFKDSNFGIHQDFQSATVLHLLSHRSGLPANLELKDYLGADGRRERLRAVQRELAQPPKFEPGSNYEYSNLGYIIAGAVVEQATVSPGRRTWKRMCLAP